MIGLGIVTLTFPRAPGENRAAERMPLLGSRRGSHPSVGTALAVLIAWLGVLSSACSGAGSASAHDVLRGVKPSHVAQLDDADRLTDDTVAVEGDPWETNLTSVFHSPFSEVDWDLGKTVHLRAAYLQGDNNDEFFVAGSTDGKAYRPIWQASTAHGPGMRARFSTEVDADVRYVRLTARGGDLSVSASELQLYDQVPEVWPPHLSAEAGHRPIKPGERETVAFAVIAALAMLLHRATWPAWLRALFVLAPTVAFIWAAERVIATWPPSQPIIDAVRAVSAAVGAVTVLRIALRPRDMMQGFVTGMLAVMAFVALTTFFNMWQPQFEDEVDGRNTWVHTWDMRVYFPTAKYFDELGFDGLYVASVAAYLEDAPGVREDRISHVELRDLTNYEMTTVSSASAQIHSIKNRFSPARWLEFKHDMSYFWKTMGAGGYLGSLRDHGGNATPVWLFIAHVLFRNAAATERNLLLAGALDPLLLGLFFVVAWRTFGVRTALVSLIVYGASTFPWFGSNWAGSTLRNDWMVFEGLGACALRAKRPALGGALCAAGAMIRAFPAAAVFFLGVPTFVWFVETLWKQRRLPSFSVVRDRTGPLVRAIGGAAVCVILTTAVSGVFFGFAHSWVDWAHKIAMHSVQPNVNHVGLKALFAYDPSRTLRALGVTGGDWSVEQVNTFQSRKPFYFLVIGIFTLITFLAARGRDLSQAALLGMMMIPIYFYPSNYYLHYVFILPLLVDYTEETRGRLLWSLISFVMLLVCVSEYWGFADIGVDERYVEWSVGALLGYLLILVALAWDAAHPVPAVVTETTKEAAPAPEQVRAALGDAINSGAALP